MQKFVHYIFVTFFVTSIAACGGGSATTAPTQIYAVPASLVAPNLYMGGAVQGGVIAAKFTNYSVSTFTGVAGSAGFSNYSTVNGPPATFNHPNDITFDKVGNAFYVADYLNNLVRKITPAGVVTTLQCTTDGTTPTGFSRPSGITTDGTNLYVVNSGSNTISFINIATNRVTTIGSTTGLYGSVDVQVISPATTADVTLVRFSQPTGITTDGASVYVTDSGNQTVRRIDIATKAVTTLAGYAGAIDYFNSDDPKVARFNQPSRITTDGTSLYLTDIGSRTIRKIDILTGKVSKVAGPDVRGTLPESIDGTSTTARFYLPNGITTDGTNLYVTDSVENTIRKIIIATGDVTTIASSADVVGGKTDSPGIPSFFHPAGITTDGTNLYVADGGNNTIRKIH